MKAKVTFFRVRLGFKSNATYIEEVTANGKVVRIYPLFEFLHPEICFD